MYLLLASSDVLGCALEDFAFISNPKLRVYSYECYILKQSCILASLLQLPSKHCIFSLIDFVFNFSVRVVAIVSVFEHHKLLLKN